MTTLKILGSSSAGNGYILQSEGETLVLELGVHYENYYKALDYKIESIVGVLVSHAHQDHANPLTIRNFYKMGISIHSTPECAERYGVRALQPKQKYFAGRFTVMPLLVPHNAQCYAYVITTPDKKKILFYTDLYDFPYKVPGVTHILGEVNYCEEKVIDNLCAGGVSSKPENHLELSKAIEIVSRHKSPLLEKVICLHLSDGNSDEREIKQRFYEELGVRVEIADKGMVINFDEDEF